MEKQPPPPPPPPQPPKASLAQGYKFIWRILLISNLALGAYIFTRPRKKDAMKKDKKSDEIPFPPETKTPHDSQGAATSTPIDDPGKMQEPIPENQWSKPFKW